MSNLHILNQGPVKKMITIVKLHIVVGIMLLNNIRGVVNIAMLQNKTHIYCLSRELTPYLWPPENEVKIRENALTNSAIWTSDSNISRSSMSLIGPVSDMRWRDFKITQSKTITISTFPSILSLSVLSPCEIAFFIPDNNHRTAKKLTFSRNSNNWIHYTVVSENYFLNISENGEILYSTHLIDERITNITIKSKKDMYWKLQEYEYKSANTVSNNKPTTLTLMKEAPCLIVYTNLCRFCYLEVFLNNSFILNITPHDKLTAMSAWQRHKLTREFKKNDVIEFYRKQTNNNSDVYWNFDARFCYLDFALYAVNGSSNNYTCHALNDDGTSDNVTFCEEAGKLGHQCDIRCAQILGQHYSYCEGHKLCNGIMCECPWGYTGNDCNEACTDGTWGLSCKHNCTKCEKCDKKTGMCISEYGSWYRQTDTIAIIISIFVFVSVVVILFRQVFFNSELYNVEQGIPLI